MNFVFRNAKDACSCKMIAKEGAEGMRSNNCACVLLHPVRVTGYARRALDVPPVGPGPGPGPG